MALPNTRKYEIAQLTLTFLENGDHITDGQLDTTIDVLEQIIQPLYFLGNDYKLMYRDLNSKLGRLIEMRMYRNRS